VTWRGIHGFHCPTLVRYGRGAANEVGTHLRNLGVRRALVVSDPGVDAAGIVDGVADAIRTAGLEVVVYASTTSNPTVTNVDEAYALWSGRYCDGVVGLGGGSAMDAAKGVSTVAANGGSILDYTGHDRIPEDLPPLVCVPTTCGTGSEVTFNAVLTDELRRVKLPYVSRRLAPQVALVDPELVEGAPSHVIAATGADALAHAVESYVNLAIDPLIDALCIGAIRMIGRNLRAAVGHEPEAIDQMTLAATMAGIAFNQNANAIVHAASTPVTARFDIAHGVANAVFMPAGLAFCLPAVPERLAAVAEALGEAPAPERGVDALRLLLADIGLPGSLRELSIDPDTYTASIPAMVEDAMKSRSIRLNPRPVTPADLEELYRAVL
jgi:alcohol dehydrogenase class IV